jgi:hypothetical protein
MKRRAAAAARPPGAPRVSRSLFLALALLAVVIGTAQAITRRWITDDAYISFRYARNLLRGLGLVFNDGERVEGYSNFLWTLWCAIGMRLGFAPESWAIGSGIACFTASLALLAAFTWARRGAAPGPLLPIAAFCYAFHRDGAIFATSGLEGSLFSLLAIAGYLLLATGVASPRRFAAAGLVLALCALARPDGMIFAALGGLHALWTGHPRGRAALAYGAAALAVLAPYAAWKLWYYGDLLPNTYYAKSADLSWFSQGWIYVRLYFQKYWLLALALPLAGWAALTARRNGPNAEDRAGPDARAAALAAAFALAYTFYVAKVGGDFMFARLLVPATPFYFVLLEIGIARTLRPAVLRVAVTAALIAGMAWTPLPMTGEQWKDGVADEWDYYQTRDRGGVRRSAERLHQLFDGLPIRAAFVGTQAIVAYYSDVPVAIESTAGLTDSFTAHQKLEKRGRPGHEKHAPWPYLIEGRKAHLILTSGRELSDTLVAYIPSIRVQLDGLVATALTWDTPIMEELARRGAVPEVDFIATLDQYIGLMPAQSDSAVRFDYGRLQRYYFDVVRDPAREAPFRARLGRAPWARP